MAKVDASFSYDAYKFLIQGIRDADADGLLERWMGGVQERFEATHTRIQELPDLVLPLTTDAEVLEYLKWIVGFSDESSLSWTEDLDEATLRKLIKNAVSLWKTKGTSRNLLDFLRSFTGRTAILRDWFFHRIIVDEADMLMGGSVNDPWIYGGQYSLLDENLTYILINRTGTTETERRLIYELFTYIHPVSAHFGIIYAAFVDDFSLGLASWRDESVDSSIGLDAGRLVFGPTAGVERVVATPNLPIASTNSWTRIYATTSVTFETADAADTITMNLARPLNGDPGDGYAATLGADGAWVVSHSDLGALDSGTYALPTPGERVQVELHVEPQGIGQIDLVFLIEHVETSRISIYGDSIFPLSGVGLSLYGGLNATGSVFASYVEILADPFRTQYVGQGSTAETDFVADPDPGLEAYVEVFPEEEYLPTILYSAGAYYPDGGALEIGVDWTPVPAVGNDWVNSGFYDLGIVGDNNSMWFHAPGTGRYPYQASDPDYTATIAGNYTVYSPSIDLSSYADTSRWNIRVKLIFYWKRVVTGGGAVPTLNLGYRLNGGAWVAIQAIPSESGTALSADPLVPATTFWRRITVSLPAGVFGESDVQIGLRFSDFGPYTTTDFGPGITGVLVDVKEA